MMEVLKIVFEGITASFRYPHFTWGRQPTFLMPPPSTIYGLISAAVGEWIAPDTVRFSYHFVYERKTEDLEHVHALTEGKGTFLYHGKKVPKNIEGKINPLRREFLYHPQFTLYLDRVDLRSCFLEPRFPLTLGRSQDLLVLNKLQIVELKQSPHVYWEHTILPWEFRPYTRMGTSVMMPRYIDTSNQRNADFQRYIVLQQRLFSGNDNEGKILPEHQLLRIAGKEPEEYWYDPDTPLVCDAHRGVLFHSFAKAD